MSSDPIGCLFSKIARKFSGKSPRVLLGLFLVLGLIGGGSAYAYTLIERQVPSNVQVVSRDIELYEDSECLTPLTAIDFGKVELGEASGIQTLWIKNTGDSSIGLELEASVQNLATGIDMIVGGNSTLATYPTWDNLGETLYPDDVVSMPLNLEVGGNTTKGNEEFTLWIKAL